MPNKERLIINMGIIVLVTNASIKHSAIEVVRIIVSIIVPLISKIWFLPFMSFW